MDIRRNVLLADANEEFRTMLREEIEKSESFAVVGSTGNGSEALELAGERRPDLLVMDVVLPGQDGLTLCARIRKNRSSSPSDNSSRVFPSQLPLTS